MSHRLAAKRTWEVRLTTWKAIKDLQEPFNDAVNYRSRHEKEFFNKVFLRTEDIDRILRPATYYLMGEKGTGKTAYATYVENNAINKTKSKLVTLTETQYKRFIALKKEGRMAYSDYAAIWRSTLLLVVSELLVARNKGVLQSYTGKFTKLEEAISKWNQHALNPEMEGALQAIESDSIRAALKAEGVGEVAAEQKSEQKKTSSTISHNLLQTETALKEAIADLRLADDHILFVDGIDFRPEHIPYGDYLACVKGLGEAAWQLNTEFLNKIRDSKGRIKVVLLIRPDIFHSLNLYNSNSKIQDNSVILTWFTTDSEYPASTLYQACGRYFASQQSHQCTHDEAWKHYFPNVNAFKRLMHLSFYRPRDILTYIKLLKSYHAMEASATPSIFEHSLLNHPRFTRDAADYLLGEVRNYSAFYMPPEDFAAYLKFFQHLDGKRSNTLAAFQEAHKRFRGWAQGEQIVAREYLRDSEALLQLFYDVNVIGYKEAATDSSEQFFHWSFRERTLNNIAPKIKNVGELLINPGIAKALDIGKQVQAQAPVPAAPRRTHRTGPRRRR
jgi:hypothetical protein